MEIRPAIIMPEWRVWGGPSVFDPILISNYDSNLDHQLSVHATLLSTGQGQTTLMLHLGRYLVLKTWLPFVGYRIQCLPE